MRRSVRRGGVAFLAVAPVAVWLSSWKVEEARFSPLTLKYQKRQSLVVLTGEVPIYRSGWEPASNEVLNYITRMKFVEPIQAEDPQWNLVHRFKQGHDGGWAPPFRCLRPDLLAWSETHPDVAPYFWQVGYALVRSDQKRETEAGYELLGRGWEYCETLPDLRTMIAILEQVYQIDVMSKAPAALRAVKLAPAKQFESVPRVGQKNAPGQFKKSQKKQDSKAKPAPPAPRSPASPPGS
jgi:hypothetical protein